MKNTVKRISIVSAIMLMLGGCGSLPEQLVSTNELVVTDYGQFVSSPDDSDIRLGGVIDTVTNLADRTRIEVVNLPINSQGKPDIDREPDGRFIAYIDGFIDPITYQRGRLLSVVGKKQGLEKAKVGEFEGEFPVIDVYGQYLWRVEERLIINRSHGAFSSCWGYYCDDFYYGPTQGHIIKEVK
jgi:outer membrane lipoprotein